LADGSLSRVLVTGGAGFIGRRAVQALLDQGHEVTTAPGMDAKGSMIPRLMRAARDGRKVPVDGDGTRRRDLVHFDDLVTGIFAAWRAGHNGPLIRGSGEPVTVNEIVDAARSVTGAETPVGHVPAKPGEMPAVHIDISAARSLGYQPRYDLKAGIATVWPEFSETAK